MLLDVWSVPEPRKYQVDMIFQLVFRKQSAYLVRKCGEFVLSEPLAFDVVDPEHNKFIYR